jgi:TatD-related deoxyribonuclease
VTANPGEHPFPVLDNHCHLDRMAEYLSAVESFWRAGGTHLNVVHKPDFSVLPTDAEGYAATLAMTCEMAEEIVRETPVKAWATISPHPVDLVKHVDRGLSVEDAEDLVRAGIEASADLVREGRAIAIGEVGRPHFEVSEDIMEASNRLFEHSMALARDIDCAIVVHTESTTPEVCADIAARADRIGLPLDRVVKHYSPPLVLPEENKGLMPSILASRRFCREATAKGDRFMLETDYLDDPRRPGAVMALTTVPKRSYGLLQDGSFTEDALHKIHVHWPKVAYGVDVEL